MKPVYQFHHASHMSGDAQAVGEKLDELRAKHDGLTPEAVVAAARDEASVLHDYFEWDDCRAAERYRLEQAGGLIRSVQVVFVEAPAQQERSVKMRQESPPQRAVRAFVSIQRGDGERTYESTERAMADAEMRRQVISRAHDELDSFSRKYRELHELAEVFQAIDHVGEKLRESAAA